MLKGITSGRLLWFLLNGARLRYVLYSDPEDYGLIYTDNARNNVYIMHEDVVCDA